jgi:putative DNA primase/helicase
MNFQNIQKSLSESEKGYADIFYENYKGIIKVASVKNKIVYEFNEKTKLYQEINENNLMNVISPLLLKVVDKLIDLVKTNDILSDTEKSKKIQSFEAKKGILGKSLTAKSVFLYLLNKYEDTEFLEKLDCNKYELPIKTNKIVNLKTGEVTERTANSYFTYELNMEYKKDADLSFIKKFFMDIATQNVPKYNFFQRVFGSSITADIKMKCFFILVGNGNNGKSVVMNAIGRLFKDMTVSIPNDLLFVEQVDKVNVTSYGTIMGKRIGVYSEPQSKLLQEASIKKLTGGDLIDGKKLYHNNVSFLPIMKIFITTNEPVFMDTSSKAMMQRVRVISFDSEFTDIPTKPNQYKIDTEIEDKLTSIYKNEFFTWLVNGAIEYFSDKYSSVQDALSQPAELQEEFNTYFNKIDKVKSFLNEYCIIDPKAKVINSVLFNKFEDYCLETGKTSIKKGVFYSKLEKLFILKKTMGENYFIGIRLKTELELQKEDYVMVDKREDPLITLKRQLELMTLEMNKYKKLYESTLNVSVIKPDLKKTKVLRQQIKAIVRKYKQPQKVEHTEEIEETVQNDDFEFESTAIDNFFDF